MEVIKYQFKLLEDERGSLVAIEGKTDIPFEIKRIYYIFGANADIRRGRHAHKELQQVLICISGSCKVLLDTVNDKCVVTLDKKNEGLYIGPGVWRELYDFSEDAILITLASDNYSEKDYIRDYQEFLKVVQCNA